MWSSNAVHNNIPTPSFIFLLFLSLLRRQTWKVRGPLMPASLLISSRDAGTEWDKSADTSNTWYSWRSKSEFYFFFEFDSGLRKTRIARRASPSPARIVWWGAPFVSVFFTRKLFVCFLSVGSCRSVDFLRVCLCGVICWDFLGAFVRRYCGLFSWCWFGDGD